MKEDESSAAVGKLVTSAGTIRIARPEDRRNDSQYVFQRKAIDLFLMSSEMERDLGLRESHTPSVTYIRRPSRNMSTVSASESMDIFRLTDNMEGSAAGSVSLSGSGSARAVFSPASPLSLQESGPAFQIPGISARPTSRTSSGKSRRSVNIVEPEKSALLYEIEKVHEPELTAVPKHGIIKKLERPAQLQSLQLYLESAREIARYQPSTGKTERSRESPLNLSLPVQESSRLPVSVADLSIPDLAGSEKESTARKSSDWRQELPVMFRERTHLYTDSYLLGTEIKPELYSLSFVKPKPEDAEAEPAKGGKGRGGQGKGAKDTKKEAPVPRHSLKVTPSRQSSRSSSGSGTRPLSRLSRASPSQTKNT